MDWLQEAKNRAEFEADVFIEEMKSLAEQSNIEVTWFLEEVIKNLNKIKNEKYK